MTLNWNIGITSASLFFVGFSCLAIAQPTTGDFLDKLLTQCSEGDMQACNEIDKLSKKYEAQLERLNAQADEFQADAPSLGIEENKTPNINKAYGIILKRYMSSDTIDPAHKSRGLDDEIVGICGRHLHDLYFSHGKEIPALQSGYPDWGTIYLVAIEHYFGFCSKRVQE